MIQAQAFTTRFERLAALRRRRNVGHALTLGVVALGPVLALATLAVLGPLDRGNASTMLRLVLLADLIYLILLAGLVALRLTRMVAERRAARAGSRLHLRLVTIFTGIALVPTVLVAIFAGLTLNIGLEGWFSNRVQGVVASALSAAEAYQQEHSADLTADVDALAAYLNRAALASQRGGADTLSDMKLNGVVANNQAVSVSTGSNLVSDGAFSGASGLPMVVQNSGNNVLIQNATIVNVQMK